MHLRPHHKRTSWSGEQWGITVKAAAAGRAVAGPFAQVSGHLDLKESQLPKLRGHIRT